MVCTAKASLINSGEEFLRRWNYLSRPFTTFTFSAGQRLSSGQRWYAWSAKIRQIMGRQNSLKVFIWVHICVTFWVPPKRKIKQRDCVWHCLQRLSSRGGLGAWWHLDWPLRRETMPGACPAMPCQCPEPHIASQALVCKPWHSLCLLTNP